MNQLLPIPSELNPSSIKDDLNARMRADDLYGISAPALVRHQAFWIRRQGDNSDQLYVNAYEALIKCLTERHYAPNPSEPITSSLCDEVVRYGIPLSVAFRYQAKFDASMRLELRGEYLSVTTIVELSEHELADQLRHSLPAESRDIKCKIELVPVVWTKIPRR